MEMTALVGHKAYMIVPLAVIRRRSGQAINVVNGEQSD